MINPTKLIAGLVFGAGLLVSAVVYVELGGPMSLTGAKHTVLELRDRAALMVAGQDEMNVPALAVEDDGAPKLNVKVEEAPAMSSDAGGAEIGESVVAETPPATEKKGFIARIIAFFKGGEETQVAEVEPSYKTECVNKGEKKVCTVTVEYTEVE